MPSIVSPLMPSAPISFMRPTPASASGLPSSRVPVSQGMTGKRTRTPRLMEIADHLADAGRAAGQVAQQVVLVAIVDADVRVNRPKQDGVDSAVAFVEVIEIAIDRVLAGDRVVEIAVFDHALRLDIRPLCPAKLGAAVLGIVVFDPLAGRLPPGLHTFEPRIAARGITRAAYHLATDAEARLLGRRSADEQKRETEQPTESRQLHECCDHPKVMRSWGWARVQMVGD